MSTEVDCGCRSGQRRSCALTGLRALTRHGASSSVEGQGSAVAKFTYRQIDNQYWEKKE